MTTQELTCKIVEIETVVARNEERIKRNDERLESIETEVKENRRLLVAVEKLASDMGNIRDKVDDICARVMNIEGKPGRLWESLTIGAILAVIGGVVGYFIKH